MPSVKNQTIELDKIIKIALEEDKYFNDITTKSLNFGNLKLPAVIKAKEDGVCAGVNIVRQIFKIIDTNIKFDLVMKDGKPFKKGDILVKINGPVESILSGERTALNFLSHLSGIATLTRQFVDKVQPYNINPVRNLLSQRNRDSETNEKMSFGIIGAKGNEISNGVKILDTRKTTPGLRLLEKYAVRMGGGYNHRFNLEEAVLIKDNHIAALRKKIKDLDLGLLVEQVKKKVKNKEIEIEVTNIQEFKQVIRHNPDIIMLDNMNSSQIKECVELRNKTSPKTQLEISGNVNLDNIKTFARLGADRISIGSLTHSPKAIDLSLEFVC